LSLSFLETLGRMKSTRREMGIFEPIVNARLHALSDDEIVRRVRAGETSLFEIPMRRYNPRLYRVARSILGNEVEAEDVMQEAYVRAFEHLDQFAGRALFSTWLTKIVVHEATAHRRRSLRFQSLGSRTGAASLSPSRTRFVGAELRLFEGELRALLDHAVDALPPDYRAVFVLREVEEMDTAETADALGVSQEVVRARLMRARATLRKDLYRRAGVTTADVFHLHLARCDRVVQAVIPRIVPVA
jgi:RNA polymerase sigma-70 factor, ECF subfamily